MRETRNVELKSIHVLGIFKFFGGAFLIVGLVIGLFANFLGINIMTTGITRIFPFITRFGQGIFSGILFGIMYGLVAGAVSSVLALLYNFFASLLGGLKFDIK